MKLAIVTAYPPSKVTLNEYAYHLVKSFRLESDVTEIILLTDRTSGEKDLSFEAAGCKITVKECWSFNSYWNIYNVIAAINETKPDNVLFNLQFMKFGDKKIAAALGLMLPLICKLKKIPTIVLLHNILEEVDLGSAGFTNSKLLTSLYGMIGTMLTKLILQADTVAVTMEKYVTILEKKYKAQNVIHIPHGTFETVTIEPSYDIPTGPLKVMTFGKFGTYKKVESMIEAVEIVRQRTKLDIEIVIAGTDNPNVPGYLKSVEHTYKAVKQLRFTGYVEESDVPKIFNESAVVIFPYTATTGSSGVLHQAGSYGKAVVMPDLGDLALLTQQEGYQGEFFDPSSVESLAVSIEALLTNEAHRKSMAQANFKAATSHPMSRIAAMYLNAFQNINPTQKSPAHVLNAA